MVSHASSRDISEPTFCPWKTMIPEQDATDSSTVKPEQDSNPDFQNFSANNGLDLLSNIAFLSGIIDSPNQFTSQFSREHESEENVKSQISTSDQEQDMSRPYVATAERTRKANVSRKDMLSDPKANYLINTAQAKFKSAVSSSPSVTVASAIAVSESDIQSSKINHQPFSHVQISPSGCSTVNRNMVPASNDQNITSFDIAKHNRPSVNRELPENAQLSYYLLNKTGIDISQNVTDGQRNPFSVFPNLPNTGQNVFSFGNMHQLMPHKRQPIPTELKEEHKENIKHIPILPWMIPHHSAHSQINKTKRTHPVSVQNWLADTHDASSKCYQRSASFLTDTAPTSLYFSSSESLVSSHSIAKPIFRTAPSLNPCQVSSASIPMVTSHPTESSVFTGKDEKIATSPSLPRSTAFQEWFSTNVFPTSAGFYQQPPARISPAMDSPVSDLDSASDSAFCSPNDGSGRSLDISDTMHNVSDRSTPSSGVHSESSSLQNVSPSPLQNVSPSPGSDNSNQSCTSDSNSSPVFQRPSNATSESPSPKSLTHNDCPLFESISSQSIPSVSQQQSVNQNPAIHPRGTSTVSTESIRKVYQGPVVPPAATSVASTGSIPAISQYQNVHQAVAVNTSGTTAMSTSQSSFAASVSVISGNSVTCLDGADVTKKKSRTNYTPAQVRSLERVFLETPYPETLVMEQLSKNLNIPEQKLKVWFQNKRARWRRRVQENKVPPVHPVFMTPQPTYGIMRPPLAPGPFFPFHGNLNSGFLQSRPNFSPGLESSRHRQPYMFKQF